MSAIQRTVKQAVVNTNANDSLYLQRVIQKIKPELVKEEGQQQVSARLLHLTRNTNNNQHQLNKNPEAVFNSLLHKTASIRNKDRNSSVGYEDTFNIYK